MIKKRYTIHQKIRCNYTRFKDKKCGDTQHDWTCGHLIWKDKINQQPRGRHLSICLSVHPSLNSSILLSLCPSVPSSIRPSGVTEAPADLVLSEVDSSLMRFCLQDCWCSVSRFLVILLSKNTNTPRTSLRSTVRTHIFTQR